MTRHILEEDIKKMVSGNPVLNNIIRAQVLDYTSTNSVLKITNLTLSYKESLQGNSNKLDNILRLFSRLTVTMVLDGLALKVLLINERDTSSTTRFSALFVQTILLLGHTKNPDHND